MSAPTPLVRHTTLVVALLLAVIVGMVTATPARAAPPADPDGGNGSTQDQLAAASRGWVEAKTALDVSRVRQQRLTDKLTATKARLLQMETEVGPIAIAAYRGTRASLTMALLSSDSPTVLLHGAATVEYMTRRDDREIHDLITARDDLSRERDALAAEIKLGEQHVAELAKRKQDLEKLLGRSSPAQGFTGGVANAAPAPRNANGTWPTEKCIVNDPTTSGCITARTLHALQQAKAAGFTRYVYCYHPGSSGEHPKGRACDFSANETTFLNSRASGDDKVYGDKLAAWFVANAGRIAVLYVIWWKLVWTPGTGWRTYHGGNGTPAGDHYNHVHLSVN
jgi:hypothetical protein